MTYAVRLCPFRRHIHISSWATHLSMHLNFARIDILEGECV
jgi:hypothetical protein